MMESDDYCSRYNADCGYASMLADLMDDMSVKQIVEYLAELTDNTVVLYTINGSHAFCARESSGTREILSMLLHLLNHPAAFDKFMSEKMTQRIPTVYDTVFLDCYGDGLPVALTAELIVEQEFIGRLFSFALDEERLNDNIKLLKIFSHILSEKIAASFTSPVPPVQEARASSDVNSGAKWLRKLSGDNFRNFYILAVEDKQDTVQREVLNQLLNQENFMFRDVVSEGYLTVMLNLRSNDELAVLQAMADHYCSTHSCYAGLSFRFHTTEHIRNGFLQAIEAINTAKYLEQPPKLCDFELLSVDALLYELMRTSQLECYRSPGIDRLCKYDRENETAYFETLKTFIDNGGSVQNTSKALFIHRNTLGYRINKIEELLGVSLHDVHTQAQIWFELKIKEILEHSENAQR